MIGSAVLTVRLLVLLLLVQTSLCGYSDLMRSSCPSTDFCTVSGNKSVGLKDGTMPCCSPCSCDADCWMFDNCCPDVGHKAEEDIQTADCKPLVVNQSMISDNDRMDYYKVVDFCPCDRRTNDQEVIDRCKDRYSGSVDFNDVVAVSDSKNRVFKNKYCAMCHGVKNIISWNLALRRCNEAYSLTRVTASNYVRAAMEGCILQSYPPSSLPYGGLIMKCSGRIEERCIFRSTTDIEEGCHFGPSTPYFHINDIGVLIKYKNVLCYLCSYKSGAKPEDACSSKLVGYTKVVIPRLSLLLDTGISKRISPQRHSSGCSEDEIYNYVQGTCDQLFCNQYSLPNNGKCVNLGTWTGAGVYLSVLLEPATMGQKYENIQSYDRETERKFALRTVQSYGLANCNIGLFELAVFSEKNSGKLVYAEIGLNIILDGKCPLNDIAHAVRYRLSNYHNTTIVINNDEIDFTGKIRFFSVDNSTSPVFSADLRYMHSGLINIRGQFTLYLAKDFFLCPFFVLNVTQYNDLVNERFTEKVNKNISEITLFTRVKHGFYTMSPNSVAVCIDTYFEMYRTSNGRSNWTRSIVEFYTALTVSIAIVWAKVC